MHSHIWVMHFSAEISFLSMLPKFESHNSIFLDTDGALKIIWDNIVQFKKSEINIHKLKMPWYFNSITQLYIPLIMIMKWLIDGTFWRPYIEFKFKKYAFLYLGHVILRRAPQKCGQCNSSKFFWLKSEFVFIGKSVMG